jgi:hypothetical protein
VWTRRCGAAIVALLTLGRGVASAEGPDSPPSTRGACSLYVALVGDAALDPILGRRITSWFDRSSFRVEVRDVPRLDAERVLSPQPGSCAWVWVTLRAERGARVYFVRGTAEQGAPSYLVRDIRLEHGLDEIGGERVAEAIHYSVLALLEGSASNDRAEVLRALEGDAAEGRTPPAKNAVAPAPDRGTGPIETRPPRRDVDVEPRAPHRNVDVGIGYAVALRGDEGVAHGPRATLRAPLVGAFSAAVSIRSALPATPAVGAIDLELYGTTFAVGLAGTVPLARSTSLDVSSGPAVEWVHYSAVGSRDPAIVDGGAESEVRPAWDFAARAVFEWPIRWAFVVECPVSLTRTTYDVATSGDRRTIGRPWALSPSAGIEVRF